MHRSTDDHRGRVATALLFLKWSRILRVARPISATPNSSSSFLRCELTTVLVSPNRFAVPREGAGLDHGGEYKQPIEVQRPPHAPLLYHKSLHC